MTLLSAARTLAARFGICASGDVLRPAALAGGVRGGTPAPHLSGVLMAILTPQNQAQRVMMAELGRGNATKMGWVAPDVDTKDGDVWRVGGQDYVVEGAEAVPDFVICALSVYRKGA